ncbi:MAG: YraN family protein [Betaproteobacteria bacterium]|nr:YraN family protein [Betaproteobacteria bacterium]
MNTKVEQNDSTDGARAESLAAAFLERQGLRVEARNFRARGGEIDLVCRDGKTLVFVEVRLRRSEAFGGAAASISATKQQRLIRAARQYPGSERQVCRFDCVLLSRLDEGAIEWLRDVLMERIT